MATTKKSQKYHLEIPLLELQRSHDAQLAGIDSIKTTVRAVFSSASLIVSLIGALQLFTVKIAREWIFVYQGVLVTIALLYLALIIICIAGMWPVRIFPVLPPRWDTLTTTFQNMNDEEMTTMHLSAVLQAIDKNGPIVNRFYRLEVAALFILPVLVLLVLFLAWLPRA